MSDVALTGALAGGSHAGAPSSKPRLDHDTSPITALIFLALLAVGFYTAYSLHQDIEAAGVPLTTWLPFLLLGVASSLYYAFMKVF